MQRRSPEMTALAFIAILFGGLLVAALAFYVVGNFAAILIIVGVIGIAAYVGLRRDRRDEPLEVRSSDEAGHHVLVLAHEGLGGPTLLAALDEHRGERRSEAVHIVVPALAGRAHRISSDVDVEIGAAARDLERLLGDVSATGVATSGEVGDSDPRLALEDALRGFPADEIVLVNPQRERMGPQEFDSTQRAVENAPLPVTVLHVGSPETDQTSRPETSNAQE